MSSKLVNIFMPVIEDNGAGGFTYNARSNEKIYLGLCLNGDTAVGNIENWFLTPINISSISGGGGNADGQTMALSWSKGEGPAVSHKVPRTA